MSEFFRGWRRKIGVATLAMACVFAAGWIRSKDTCDVVTVYGQGDNLRYHVISQDGELRFEIGRPHVGPRFDLWMPGENLNVAKQRGVCSVSYLSLFLPLTLLSAYLLLSKPRPRKPPESTTQRDEDKAIHA